MLTVIQLNLSPLPEILVFQQLRRASPLAVKFFGCGVTKHISEFKVLDCHQLGSLLTSPNRDHRTPCRHDVDLQKVIAAWQ